MRVGRLIRDILLIPAPLALLSLAFFIAGIAEAGVLMLAFTLAAAWYIRPRRAETVGASVPGAEEDIAPEVPL